MKKELPGSAMAAILAVFVVLVASVGWYFINRPSPTVATTGNIQKNGNRGARSIGSIAPATTMPNSQ